jgi:hypothetical protein
VTVYEDIMDRYELVFEAVPMAGKITGNRVRIYRVNREDETG